MKWTVCFEAWNFTRQDLKSAETPTELPHILSALSSHGNRHGRTPGIASGILTRKPPIFLRTFLEDPWKYPKMPDPETPKKKFFIRTKFGDFYPFFGPILSQDRFLSAL